MIPQQQRNYSISEYRLKIIQRDREYKGSQKRYFRQTWPKMSSKQKMDFVSEEMQSIILTIMVKNTLCSNRLDVILYSSKLTVQQALKIQFTNNLSFLISLLHKQKNKPLNKEYINKCKEYINKCREVIQSYQRQLIQSLQNKVQKYRELDQVHNLKDCSQDIQDQNSYRQEYKGGKYVKKQSKGR